MLKHIAAQVRIAELEHELAVYKTMLDRLPIMVWSKDFDGRYLAANQRVADVAGVETAQQIMGRTDHEVFPPEIAECYLSGDREVLASAQPILNEEPSPGGWQETGRQPLTDHTGKLIGTVGFARDITAQKQRCKLCGDGERQLSSFVANLPGFAYSARRSPTGRFSIPFASPGIKDIFGLPPEALHENIAPILALIHPEDAPRFKAAVVDTVDATAPIHHEARIQRPGQPERWIELRATPLREADGGILWHGLMLDISKRKRMEETLADREHEFRSLVENSQDIITRYDLDGRRIYANPSFAKSLQIDSSSVVGLPARQPIIPTTDGGEGIAQQIGEAVDTVIREQRPLEIELAGNFTDRPLRYCHVRFQPEFDEHGQLASVLGVARDITVLKETEQALRKTQNRLTALVDSMPDLVWMKDGEGVYLACNKAFEAFFGAPESAIVGRTDYDFVDRELADFFRQKDREAAIAGQLCINEETITYADDGRSGLLETRKIPVLGAAGEIIGILGISRDVTERKRLETELARREAEFRTIVENTSDTIARYDLNCRRLYCNPALAAASKVDIGELLGKTPAECSPFSPAAAETYTNVVRLVLTSAQACQTEVHWENNGIPACMQLRVTPEFDSAGQIVSAFAIGRDVSALKQSEEHLRQSHDILRALAQHREGEHEAERREIVRQIHEDLAQNLSALRMNIGLIQFNGAAAPFQPTLETMRDISDRCIVRIRDMVSMLRPTVLELGIVHALQWLTRDFAKRIGFKYDLDLPPQDDIGLDDEKSTFLFRAAREALVNITLHAAASQISLTLRKRDGRYRLSIRDNGRGFDTGRPYPAGAFGLIGLTEQAHHLGGILSVKSTLRQGTTLEIDLPATPPGAPR